MLTTQEFSSLILILQRAALNPVEALAVEMILQKIRPLELKDPTPQENNEKN